MENSNGYWNHNTAYHNWILKQIDMEDTVIDVGCGDGLLVSKLAHRSKKVIGLDTHLPSIVQAQERLEAVGNASVFHVSFEDFAAAAGSTDAVIFAASIHHMDMEKALIKAKELLSPRGKILIVGIAKPAGILDTIIEVCRVIPAKLSSLIHHETTSEIIGVPTAASDLSIKQIRSIAGRYLPNARIHRGLYYRYLLSWIRAV